MDGLSRHEHELECEAGRTVRLFCSTCPGLQLAAGPDIPGKLATNYLVVSQQQVDSCLQVTLRRPHLFDLLRLVSMT